MSKHKRPTWVPKTAKDWGFKVLTTCRTSPVKPIWRTYGCGVSQGSAVLYPFKITITELDFCNCNSICCKGLHYFRSLEEAYDMFREDRTRKYIVVRCYVPREGRFVVRNSDEGENKYRASQLITLEAVNKFGNTNKYTKNKRKTHNNP